MTDTSGFASSPAAKTIGLNAVANPTDFAHALLNYMGLPDTDANVQALVSWAAAEGGNWNNTAAYNPFNTTQVMPGSQVMPGGNSAGVQAYTSWQQGIEATAKTLQYPAYSQIIAALRAGNNAGAVAHAVTTSPWGTHVIDLGSAANYGSTTGGAGGGGIVTSTGNVSNGQAPAYNPGTQYPATTDQERQWLETYAPQYLWMLNDPQVANIVAYAKQYQLQDVTGLLQQTDWWKQHSTYTRTAQQTYANDPATWLREINQAGDHIKTMAGQLGVNLTPEQVSQLSFDVNYFGLNDEELRQAIGQYSTTAKPSASLDTLKATANQYMVPISDQTLQQWLQQVNSGTSTTDQFTAYVKDLAKSKFPWMTAQIDAGQTATQILDPYKQSIATVLQTDPGTVNLLDPKYQKLLYTTDPKTGQQVQMPLWQAEQQVRSDPVYGYQNTPNAKNAAYDTALQLTKLMGQVA